MHGALRALLGPLPFAALLVACEGSDAQFATRIDPALGATRHAVSVLGAYQDGRPSSEAWDLVAPSLTSALRSSRCELGYNTLVASSDPRADLIEEHARGDRSTEELVANVGPGAQGDLILVVQVDGNLPDRERVASKMRGGGGRSAAPQSLGGHTSGRLGGMPGRGSLATTTSFEGAGDSALLDRSMLGITASFFSVRDGRVVASVSMDYTGARAEEASEKFAAKLVRSLPEMTCVGWRWDSPSALAPRAPAAPSDALPPTGVPGLTNGI